MEKVYELLKKYAKQMVSLGYPIGGAAMLAFETEDGVYGTIHGAKLDDLRPEDVEKLRISNLPMSAAGMKAMVYSQTPYCQRCLAEGVPFRASIDDMAQIIGPAVYIADGRPKEKKNGKSLAKAVRHSTGAFVLLGFDGKGKGAGYTITFGRNLYEAVVAMAVLEKSAEITTLAERIGGVKPIRKFEAKLMRAVYKRKYSKSEEDVKNAELESGVIETVEEVNSDEGHKSREQLLREQLVEYGKKLVRTGLVQGTWGNISARLDDKYMIVTPSGLDYERLTAKDMVKVEIDTLKYEGSIKPTSEKGLHAEIYKRRADVGSVIHTHSKYCCVYAAAEKSIDVTNPDMRAVFGNEVKLAKYGLPGTDQLKKNTADAMGENFGCIMSHHGMAVCGKDLETAFGNAEKLEECAKISLYR